MKSSQTEWADRNSMPRPGYFIVQAMDDNAKAAKVVFERGADGALRRTVVFPRTPGQSEPTRADWPMNTTLDAQPELPKRKPPPPIELLPAAQRDWINQASTPKGYVDRDHHDKVFSAVKFRRTSDGALERVVHDGRRKDPDEPRVWKMMNSNTHDVPFLGRRPRTSPAMLISRAAAAATGDSTRSAFRVQREESEGVKKQKEWCDNAAVPRAPNWPAQKIVRHPSWERGQPTEWKVVAQKKS